MKNFSLNCRCCIYEIGRSNLLKKLKIIFVFLLLTFGSLKASAVFSQSVRLNLNLSNIPVKDVLKEIEDRTDYSFMYNGKFVDVNRKVSVSAKNETVENILNTIFSNTDVVYRMVDKQIILTIKNFEEGNIENKNNTRLLIGGTVIDANDKSPIPGVAVQVKDTDKGTLTDFSGNFSIEAADANATLVFTFMGYESQTIALQGRTNIIVELKPKDYDLEEVMVTALGIKRDEKALGYAVKKMDGEMFQTIKMADMTTSLTGKVSGLVIKNSTNFGTDALIKLRGEKPLIVIDGVPTDNVSINDLSPDDVQSINILKGATASALYGYRGASGAIIITTLRGNRQKGFSVTYNTSTMFSLGFVVLPETQTSYSSGFGGKYGDDYVWGDKLDIGRTATLWDPFEKVWKENMPLESVGKNNLKNFQQPGFITNNNISIATTGENASLRSSISYIYDQGQFPNQKMNKVTYSLGGEATYNKLTLESNISYSKHISPNIRGSQYSGGYLYNLIGWLGAEFDVRDYKDYWLVPDVSQNWFNMEWYDNPYFLANEVLKSADRDILNGYVSMSYQLADWLKISLRSGFDSYLNRYIYRNPISARNAYSELGYFEDEKQTGYSTNNDLILSFDKTFGKFRIEGIAGGTLFFTKSDYFDAWTKGGLSIPGFYSLRASVDPIGWNTSLARRQVNSLYGRATFSYASLMYVDVTGRNDWNSTLSEESRSYFYPSVAASFIVSELLPDVKWLDIWKLRGSWTVSKTPAGVYDIMNAYTIQNEVWGGFNSAYFPTSLRSDNVRPQTMQSSEVGTQLNMLQNRLRLDFTYYQTRIYDFLASAAMSDATGFTSKYVNTEEERTKKGIEIDLGFTPVKTSEWVWNVNLNYSKDATYYSKIDSQYTPDQPWIYEGARVDVYTVKDWLRDPQGNMIHVNGFPVRSNYYSIDGYENPEWVYGIGSDVSYKALTFSFSIDGRVGGVSFSRLDALLWHSGAHIGTDNQWRYDEVVNGKKNYVGKGVKVVSGEVSFDTQGNVISDSRVYAPNDVQVSYESYMKDNYARGPWSWTSQDILDETFLKLREVSLSYQVPAPLTSRIKMKNMVVSVVGQNLFFWGKEYKISDPDYGEAWDLVSPSIRYLGFNIKFNL